MLLDEQQLLAWTGYKRRADLERFLDAHRVRWWPGRDGQVCTTLAVLEAAMSPAQAIPEFA